MQICLFVNGPVWYAILIIREQEVLACKWDFVCCRCPCVVSFIKCNSEKVLGSDSANLLLRVRLFADRQVLHAPAFVREPTGFACSNACSRTDVCDGMGIRSQTVSVGLQM